jgi:hypothetical protein
VADLAQDIRYSVRVLRRSPGYAIVVIAVLALGIGANVSVFSFFKALALKPIPRVEGAASLGVLVARTDAGRILPLSHPDFRDMQEQSRAFADLAGTSMDPYSIGLGMHGERVFGEMVTGNYFDVLGVRASLGRTLLPSDDLSPGRHPVVVISDGLWKRVFTSDPAIVGKTIQVNAYPMTIVGVAEPGFHGNDCQPEDGPVHPGDDAAAVARVRFALEPADAQPLGSGPSGARHLDRRCGRGSGDDLVTH